MDESVLIAIADAIYGDLRRTDARELTVEKADDYIKNFALVKSMGLSDDDCKKIKYLMEQSGQFVYVQMQGATLISRDTVRWLGGEREENIEWKYWLRLRNYLSLESGFSNAILNRLDEESRDIINLCGDPDLEGSWKRAGLVVGHVQSGKTTNYSAVISKGISAGYKVFLVFAGITNSLRLQTQERLEDNVTGRSARRDGETAESLWTGQRLPRPTVLTGVKDFSTVVMNTVASDLDGDSVHFFVLKKNPKTIENVINWLTESDNKPNPGISAPMMLIDDEADNASINTLKSKAITTKINAGIRKILTCFDRSVYLGYTATPFANIFIDHDTDKALHASLGDDLFPRNFIKSITAPVTYIGGTKLFSAPDNGGGSLSHTVAVIPADDYAQILPLSHKRDIAAALVALPQSLKTAIEYFVLYCAIERARGRWDRHMTMMINVSRFNDVQHRVEDLVEDYLSVLRNAIENSAMLGVDTFNDEPVLIRLKDLYFSGGPEDQLNYNYGSERGEVPYAKVEETKGLDFFKDIVPNLFAAAKAIKPKTVNMKHGGLEYPKRDYKKVIAIGGLALSRGLTLEGLVITYLLRNAGASDTLMQMARWFGYRNKFENLTRVFLPKISFDHYRAVNHSIEELRDELKLMESTEKSPLDFGLKVRNSSTGILITAANKSRSASRIKFTKDLQYKHIQSYLLSPDKLLRESNLMKMQNFVEGAFHHRASSGFANAGNFLSWSASGSEVWELVRGLQLPNCPDFQLGVNGEASFVDTYIRNRLNENLSNWDVVVPVYAGGKILFSLDQSTSVKLLRRHSGLLTGNEKKLLQVTSGNAVAIGKDLEFGLDPKQCLDLVIPNGSNKTRELANLRNKPLLLLHFIDCKINEKHEASNEKRQAFSGSYGAVSILFNGSNVLADSHEYTANKVLQMNGFSNDDDYDLDEDHDAMMEGA